MLDKIRHVFHVRDKNLGDLLFELLKFINYNDGKIDIIEVEITQIMDSPDWQANVYYEIIKE